MYPTSTPTNKSDKILQRIFEIIPGSLTWFTLIIAVAASFFWPISAALFIIAFDFYWLIKAVYMSIYLVAAYKKKQEYEKIDWMGKLKNTPKSEFPDNAPDWQDIYHLIIFPTANEPVEIIKDAFDRLLESNYPKEKMIVVLATEERDDSERRNAKEELVMKNYSDKFFKTFVIRHPDGIEGEKKVKSANATWAVKEVKRFIDQIKLDYEKIIVSNFDSDTCAHPEYFAYAAYLYLMAPDRIRCSLQPLPMYNNNLWDAPFFVRVIAVSSSFWHMIESLRPERLVTFSSHSMSFKALSDVDYWPVDMVSEDSAIFWRCFDYYNGDYRSIPMYMHVSLDAVVSGSLQETLANQYKQKRRWAWGIENFPLVMRSFIKNKKIKISEKIKHTFILLEGNRSWATDSFIVVILGWLPLIVGGKKIYTSIFFHSIPPTKFCDLKLFFSLPGMTRILMTFAMVGLIVSAALGTLLLPPRPEKYGKLKSVMMVLQWIIVPVIAPILGALPAVDAQTRLALGKKFHLGFWVTKKVRK